MRKSRRQLEDEREFPTEEETLANLTEVLSVFISHHFMLHGPNLTLDAEEMARAAMVFIAPSVRKALARARIEERARLMAGDNRSRAAQHRKRAALTIAARLQTEQPLLRLPGKKLQLATRVWEELDGPERPSIRTIRRWIAEALAKEE